MSAVVTQEAGELDLRRKAQIAFGKAQDHASEVCAPAILVLRLPFLSSALSPDGGGLQVNALEYPFTQVEGTARITSSGAVQCIGKAQDQCVAVC